MKPIELSEEQLILVRKALRAYLDSLETGLTYRMATVKNNSRSITEEVRADAQKAAKRYVVDIDAIHRLFSELN